MKSKEDTIIDFWKSNVLPFAYSAATAENITWMQQHWADFQVLKPTGVWVVHNQSSFLPDRPGIPVVVRFWETE